MCLGVPGKVLEIHSDEGLSVGTVDFAGIRRAVCFEYAPEVRVGNYVVVHVGFAISIVDEEEALRAYALLEEMGNLEGVDVPSEIERPASAARAGEGASE